MKLFFTLPGLVLLLLLASTAQADSITTIQLQNRPAVEVIPIVKPMLEPGDAITGQGFKIFLRSSPETLAQVRDLIDALDTAAKILQISVFQGSDRDIRSLAISGNIQIESGDASVNVGNNKNNNANSGGSIGYDNGKVSGNVKTTSTRARLQDNPVHQLRVTEGTEGYIETGEQIPYFSGANRIAPGLNVGSVEFKDVTTGFYVLPRIHGDNVTLQISPFKNSVSKTGGGNIETQQANTTITGGIGKWLLIGGTTEEIKRSQSGTGSYSSTKSRRNESIWIKVDLVR